MTKAAELQSQTWQGVVSIIVLNSFAEVLMGVPSHQETDLNLKKEF